VLQCIDISPSTATNGEDSLHQLDGQLTTSHTHDNPALHMVAIKVMRANDMMSVAGDKELSILRKIQAADPEDRHHVIRLEGEGAFAFRGHTCVVLEHMHCNLR